MTKQWQLVIHYTNCAVSCLIIGKYMRFSSEYRYRIFRQIMVFNIAGTKKRWLLLEQKIQIQNLHGCLPLKKFHYQLQALARDSISQKRRHLKYFFFFCNKTYWFYYGLAIQTWNAASIFWTLPKGIRLNNLCYFCSCICMYIRFI